MSPHRLSRQIPFEEFLRTMLPAGRLLMIFAFALAQRLTAKHSPFDARDKPERAFLPEPAALRAAYGSNFMKVAHLPSLHLSGHTTCAPAKELKPRNLLHCPQRLMQNLA